MYTRPTYVLSCDDNCLLILDAATTTPFSMGETVELYNAYTGDSLGWFVVEHLTRRVPFGVLASEPYRVPLAGHELTVHLRRREHPEEQPQPLEVPPLSTAGALRARHAPVTDSIVLAALGAALEAFADDPEESDGQQ